ncbi:TetR/AcrR family transcriptional regulator [Amedibacillus sp. YH-ame10]
METLDKSARIQQAAIALFKEQGVESTSVNEIVKRANVAKGTFYLYYKDKSALISQILTKQHGTLINEIVNRSYEKSKKQGSCWKQTFVEELIQNHRCNPLLLKTIQKNMPYILDTEEHRSIVFKEVERLEEFLSLWKREGEEDRMTLNRMMLLMEIVSVICYNALSFDHPDILENLLPEVKRVAKCIMDSEVDIREL